LSGCPFEQQSTKQPIAFRRNLTLSRVTERIGQSLLAQAADQSSAWASARRSRSGSDRRHWPGPVQGI